MIEGDKRSFVRYPRNLLSTFRSDYIVVNLQHLENHTARPDGHTACLSLALSLPPGHFLTTISTGTNAFTNRINEFIKSHNISNLSNLSADHLLFIHLHM